MASVGHTSMQALQPVQRSGTSRGLPAAGRSARGGQVTMQLPQAVHRPSMTIMPGSAAAGRRRGPGMLLRLPGSAFMCGTPVG